MKHYEIALWEITHTGRSGYETSWNTGLLQATPPSIPVANGKVV